MFYIVDGNINPSYYLITKTFPSDLSYFAMFEMRLRVEALYSGIHVARDMGHDVWTLVSATCSMSSGVNFYLGIHCLYACARFLRHRKCDIQVIC